MDGDGGEAIAEGFIRPGWIDMMNRRSADQE